MQRVRRVKLAVRESSTPDVALGLHRLLEAMFLEVPVVARHNIGNCSLLADADGSSSRGCLFKTVEECAKAVARIASDVQFRNALTVSGAVGSQHPSWHALTTKAGYGRLCAQAQALLHVQRRHSRSAEQAAWDVVVSDVVKHVKR